MKHKLFGILAIIFLIIQTFPPINRILPVGDAFKLAGFMGAALLLFPNLFFRPTIVALIIYTLETLVYYLMGNAYFDSINSVVVPFLQMATALMLTEYIFKYDRDYKFTRIALLVAIVSTVLISIISIPILSIYPEIIRLAYSYHTNTEAEVLAISSFVISWGAINGIAYLVAPMAFICKKTYKKNKKAFWFWTISLLILLFIVFRSNVTTPLVIALGMLVIGLFFSYERFTRSNISKIFITGIVGAALLYFTVIPMLDFALSNIDYGSTYQRIGEIKEKITTGESSGDLEGREERFDISWNLFVESPITGTQTPEKISRHTYFVDRLACHGIFLILPLVLVFVYFFKNVYKRLIHSKVVFTYGFASIIFMLFYKNEALGVYGLFLLPCICRYIDYIIEENKTNVKKDVYRINAYK